MAIFTTPFSSILLCIYTIDKTTFADGFPEYTWGFHILPHIALVSNKEGQTIFDLALGLAAWLCAFKAANGNDMSEEVNTGDDGFENSNFSSISIFDMLGFDNVSPYHLKHRSCQWIWGQYYEYLMASAQSYRYQYMSFLLFQACGARSGCWDVTQCKSSVMHVVHMGNFLYSTQSCMENYYAKCL